MLNMFVETFIHLFLNSIQDEWEVKKDHILYEI